MLQLVVALALVSAAGTDQGAPREEPAASLRRCVSDALPAWARVKVGDLRAAPNRGSSGEETGAAAIIEIDAEGSFRARAMARSHSGKASL